MLHVYFQTRQRLEPTRKRRWKHQISSPDASLGSTPDSFNQTTESPHPTPHYCDFLLLQPYLIICFPYWQVPLNSGEHSLKADFSQHIKCICPMLCSHLSFSQNAILTLNWRTGRNSVTSLLCPGRGAEYCDQFVCLSVQCASACLCICVCVCLSVCNLLWQHCDTLCTSGFMDDVTFGRSGPYSDAWLAELRYWGGVWFLWMPCFGMYLCLTVSNLSLPAVQWLTPNNHRLYYTHKMSAEE